tara:strand:+ start:3441 stop:4196 length:756 start_codon:yes stop_codon:yes gene_type:complete
MDLKKFKILKMKDVSDSFVTKKEQIFNLPMRLLIIGKSGDGKSGYLGNLLLRKEFYRDDFLPENIFIFSGSVNGDKKLQTIIDEIEIPETNIFSGYDEDNLEGVYDHLVDEFNDNVDDGIKDKKKLNSIVILDDLAFNNSFKDKGKNDMIRKVYMNGRKYSISIMILSQKYSAVSTSIRENITGLILGKSSNKQLEMVSDDHNYLKGKDGKKRFIDMVKTATDKPFSKFIINFTQPELYQDTDFEALQEPK